MLPREHKSSLEGGPLTFSLDKKLESVKEETAKETTRAI